MVNFPGQAYRALCVTIWQRKCKPKREKFVGAPLGEQNRSFNKRNNKISSLSIILDPVRSAIYYNAQPGPLGIRLSSHSMQPKSYPVKLIDQNTSLAALELVTRYFLECLQKTTPSLIVLKVCQSGPDCESTSPRG